MMINSYKKLVLYSDLWNKKMLLKKYIEDN